MASQRRQQRDRAQGCSPHTLSRACTAPRRPPAKDSSRARPPAIPAQRHPATPKLHSACILASRRSLRPSPLHSLPCS
eukprot:scaffold260567_cov28-Tisochrysis_lutea.AAC.4